MTYQPRIATGRLPLWKWPLFDWFALLLLVMPVYGTFFPVETYFGSVSDGTYTMMALPVTPVSLVIVSLTVVWIYLRVRQRQRVVHTPLAYLFVAAAFATVLWSPDPQGSFQRALRLLPAVSLGVLLPQFYGPKRLLELMTIGFLVSALASIFVSVFVPSLGIGDLGNGYEYAWRGALLHKNSTGFLYSVGLVIAIYGWIARAAWRPFCLAAALACLLMVVKADSATAILSAMAGLVVAALIAPLRRVDPAVALLLGLAVLLLFLIGTTVALVAPQLLFESAGRDMTFTGRTDIWSEVIQTLSAHPLRGMWYGFWGIDSPSREEIWQGLGYKVPFSHNSWLDLWLQTGLVGLAAMALFSVLAVGAAVRPAFRDRSALGTLPLAILVLVLIRTMTEVEFVDPGIGGVFWLVWAAAAAKLGLRRTAIRPAAARPARHAGVPTGRRIGAAR